MFAKRMLATLSSLVHRILRITGNEFTGVLLSSESGSQEGVACGESHTRRCANSHNLASIACAERVITPRAAQQSTRRLHFDAIQALCREVHILLGGGAEMQSIRYCPNFGPGVVT